MGPDGEDGLATFLQTKLKGWQASLNGYKQLADTGDYPGSAEITEGLTFIGLLLADKESRRFIERFNTLKKDLIDLAAGANCDDLAKSLHQQGFVIPAKAGIQHNPTVTISLDPGFHRGDDFLRVQHSGG